MGISFLHSAIWVPKLGTKQGQAPHALIILKRPMQRLSLLTKAAVVRAGTISHVSLAYSQDSSAKSNVNERETRKENELGACSSADRFAR
jgi:hypothetical protein